MNFVRSTNLSLKYQNFTQLGCDDLGIRKYEFVTLSVMSLWQEHNCCVSLNYLELWLESSSSTV